MSLIVGLLIGSDPCIVGSVLSWLGAALTAEVLHTLGKSSTAHLQQENTIAVDIHFCDCWQGMSASGAAEHLSIFPFGKWCFPFLGYSSCYVTLYIAVSVFGFVMSRYAFTGVHCILTCIGHIVYYLQIHSVGCRPKEKWKRPREWPKMQRYH